MAATFVCPHCGYSYPMKPVLIGRSVRCTGCKQAFQLGADGIALKVGALPTLAAETPAPAPAPAAPIGPAASAQPPAPAAMPSPRPAGNESSDKLGGSRGTKLTRQQEDARRAMAGTLATAATHVLKAESLKQDATKADNKARKTAKDGTAGKIGPAVVVGEGDRAARTRRWWLLGVGSVVALLVLIIVMSSIKSPERKALDAYAAPDEDFRKHRTQRIQSIQDRALFPNAVPLVDVGRVRIGAMHPMNTAAVRPIISGSLKGKTLIRPLSLWAPADKAVDVERLWDGRKGAEVNNTRLAAQKIEVVPHAEILAKLKDAGLTDDDIELLLTLMTEKTNTVAGDKPLSARLLSGDIPDRIEITSFRGTKGTMLLNMGRESRLQTANFQGRLIRFSGAGWPMGWHVLDVRLTTN